LNLIGIQIQAVEAYRVDHAGRVLGVRVRGVADQNLRSVFVSLFPAPANIRDASMASYQFGVEVNARFLGEREAIKLNYAAASWHEVVAPGTTLPTAYAWCADIDLLDHPKHPPVHLGHQAQAMQVQASYLGGLRKDLPPALYLANSLSLVKEFPLGVLFVHGIGMQTKSETLSGWTAPLLSWINNWFDGASHRAATQAQTTDAEHWLSALVVREDYHAFDADAGDRHRMAEDFTARVLSKTYAGQRQRMHAGASRSLNNSKQRSVKPEEEASRQRFEQHLVKDLGINVVHGEAALADARLIDGDAPISQPSTVEMHIQTLLVDGTVERSQWLMAESMWAESFRAPSFGSFVAWCLCSVPAIWLHYFAMIFERSGRSWPRALLSLLPLTTVVLLAILAMAALWLLAVVPVDRLRSALLSVQRRLAGVVGDSYIFLCDAVQRRAIVDRVQRDVEWLSLRCRKVVVVAHSQGAAVADKALNNVREYSPQSLSALVTLGAGVQTLERLSELRDRPLVQVIGWMALAAGALFWVGVTLFFGFDLPWLGVALFVGGAGGMTLAAVRGWKEHPGWSTVPLAAASIKPWYDFFATRDPVPMGPLVDPKSHSTASQYYPSEVSNRASYLSDHTSYWQNPEQVVGPIARVLADADQGTFIDGCMPDARALEAQLVRSRNSRLRWLRTARLITWLTVFWIAWWQRDVAIEFFTWGWSAIGSRNGLSSGDVAFPGWGAILRTASIIVPWLLYAAVITAAWDAWGDAELRRILQAQHMPANRTGLLTFAVLLAALPTIAVALTVPITFLQFAIAWAVGGLLTGGVVHTLHKKRQGTTPVDR
jgi:hypothetical protein